MELFKSRAKITHWACNKSYDVENIHENKGCPYCQDTTGGYNIKYLDNNCEDCKEFYTYPIIYPSGSCNKHNIGCGMGEYCEDFIKR